MSRIALAVAALIAGATLVHAESEAIAQRRAIMKAGIVEVRKVSAMARGETAFDLETVQHTLKMFSTDIPKLKELFPEDSQTGSTNALPAIWQRKAEFLGRYDKMAADVASISTAVTDEASFKANWPKLGGNCGGCHRDFKKPE